MSEQIIHILDENTANKIAAGEVVERPAAVVKELVENSIDAGSRNIEVEITDGGTKYIRVTDDGRGMSPADAKLAVKRHATSKIKTADDLIAISSLGFRGEALPSIAAVSKFTLTTRQLSDSLATYVEIHGGIEIDVREAGAGCGTTITVAELFFNTPARQKFLKTPSAESGHINDIVTKLALSHPEIAFKLINNGRMVLTTGGSGKLIDTLADIYGHKVSPEMLPVDFEGEGIAVSGYVAKPVLLKSSRLWQTLMVNDRVVSSRMVAKALDNAYFSLLPKNGYPLAVLHIHIPLETIDVNVHPQKKEVKFSDEQKIYRAVYKGVTNALASPASHAQAATVVQSTVPQPQPIQPSRALEYTPSTALDFTPAPKIPDAYNAPNHSYRGEPAWNPSLWKEESLPISSARKAIDADEELLAPQPNINYTETCPIYPLGQIEACYIVAQGEDGLYIIDQHAAHERILYDKMSRSKNRVTVQQLLVPQYLEFTGDDCTIMNENQATFYDLGFTLEQVGPDSMRLLEMPADIPLKDAAQILHQILKLIADLHRPTAQELRHAYLQIASCRSAIKAGETLNMRQIQALISELYTTDLPYTCPHGRPTIIKFGAGDLAKMFKRT